MTCTLISLRSLSPLTSIDAGFHKDADGVNAALEVVRSDMGSVPHQKGQSLGRLHQGASVPTHQLLSQLDAVLVHANRRGGSCGGARLFSVHLLVANQSAIVYSSRAAHFRQSKKAQAGYWHQLCRYPSVTKDRVLCDNVEHNRFCLFHCLTSS